MREKDSASLPVFDADADAEATYSPEVVGELTGLSMEAITHYCELGLLSSASESASPAFTVESVRILRRIEHLRNVFGLNDTALKLAIGLLNEVEQLHDALRARR